MIDETSHPLLEKFITIDFEVIARIFYWMI